MILLLFSNLKTLNGFQFSYTFIIVLIIYCSSQFEQVHTAGDDHIDEEFRYKWDYEYKIKKWEFEENLHPPANLTYELIRYIGKNHASEMIIELWMKNRREDFNLTILGNPFVKNDLECVKLDNDTKIENLRHFLGSCQVIKGNRENQSLRLGKIFTGCYHFVMTNKEGTNWQSAPVFYNTSYRYVNTKVAVIGNIKFIPEDSELTMQIQVSLRVPLLCMEVRTRLYQLKGNISNAIDGIKNGSILYSQDCWFWMIDGNVEGKCELSKSVTSLELEVIGKVEDGEAWKATLVWKNLQRGGGTYSLWITKDSGVKKCREIYNSSDLDTWIPIDGGILEDLEFRNSSNEVIAPPSKSPNFFWIFIGWGLAVVVAIVILSYCIWKHRRLIKEQFLKIDKHDITRQEEPSAQIYEKESDQILLMYEKDSASFMKEMDGFRRLLKQGCPGCQIHDIYATNKWSRIHEIRAPQWILELLADGSKIVWVDTPQFRSRFDEEREYTAADFRDHAVPYAVGVAINSYQNSITQYRRHFVVQIKGFEVQAGTKDPLKVVSPRTRYYIPEQLSQLCEDLKGMVNHVTNPAYVGEELSSRRVVNGDWQTSRCAED